MPFPERLLGPRLPQFRMSGSSLCFCIYRKCRSGGALAPSRGTLWERQAFLEAEAGAGRSDLSMVPRSLPTPKHAQDGYSEKADRAPPPTKIDCQRASLNHFVLTWNFSNLGFVFQKREKHNSDSHVLKPASSSIIKR